VRLKYIIERKPLALLKFVVRTFLHGNNDLCARCASTITKKHATQNPERDALKRGELDDEASPTFPKEHRADKYGGEPYKGREI
jgi:hypothetical protein